MRALTLPLVRLKIRIMVRADVRVKVSVILRIKVMVRIRAKFRIRMMWFRFVFCCVSGLVVASV